MSARRGSHGSSWKFPDTVKRAADRYIEKVVEEGRLTRSLEFNKARLLFYKQMVSANTLGSIDKKECIFQIRKLTYIIEKLEEKSYLFD